MVDLSGKIETDLESKTPNILEENVNNDTQENNSNQSLALDAPANGATTCINT